MSRMYTRICNLCGQKLLKDKRDFPWSDDITKPEWCQLCIRDISQDLINSIDWASLEKEIVAEANDTC